MLYLFNRLGEYHCNRRLRRSRRTRAGSAWSPNGGHSQSGRDRRHPHQRSTEPGASRRGPSTAGGRCRTNKRSVHRPLYFQLPACIEPSCARLRIDREQHLARVPGTPGALFQTVVRFVATETERVGRRRLIGISSGSAYAASNGRYFRAVPRQSDPRVVRRDDSAVAGPVVSTIAAGRRYSAPPCIRLCDGVRRHPFDIHVRCPSRRPATFGRQPRSCRTERTDRHCPLGETRPQRHSDAGSRFCCNCCPRAM